MRSHQKPRRSSSNQGRASHNNGRNQGDHHSPPETGDSQTRNSRSGGGGRQSDMAKIEKKWILLNVGGSYFLTSRPTLTRLTPVNSPLYRLSINSTNVQFDRDDRGAYLIDRDPAYFAVLLNYLRHGHLLLTKDITEEGVLLEAEYFNIPELHRLVKQRLGHRYNLLFSQQQQQPQQQQQFQTTSTTSSIDYLSAHNQQGAAISVASSSSSVNQLSASLGNNHHQQINTNQLIGSGCGGTIGGSMSSGSNGTLGSNGASSLGAVGSAMGAFNSFGLGLGSLNGGSGGGLGGLLEV